MYFAISTGYSLTLKCPESSKCSSAFGTSFKYALAPAAINAGSFLPHTINVGGW